MDFSLLEASERPALLKLLTGIYPHLGWSPEYFEWQYEKNPAGPAKSWCAKRGGEIIGNFTAVPFEMIVKGEVCLGWRAQDVLTLPAYAGFGVYFRLSALANEFLKTAIHPLNFAFPNERSHNGFIKNGWLDAFRIPLWILEDLKQAPSAPLKSKIEPLTRFDQRVEKIWRSYAKQIDFALNRNAKYLEWRYFARPGAKYFPFILSQGSDELVMILKYYDRENGERWAHLCDFFQSGTNETLYADALQHVVRFAKENKCKAVSAWHPQGKLDPLFERFQMKLQNDLTRWLVVNPNGPAPDEIHRQERWHLAMGDSDVY